MIGAPWRLEPTIASRGRDNLRQARYIVWRGSRAAYTGARARARLVVCAVAVLLHFSHRFARPVLRRYQQLGRRRSLAASLGFAAARPAKHPREEQGDSELEQHARMRAPILRPFEPRDGEHRAADAVANHARYRGGHVSNPSTLTRADLKRNCSKHKFFARIQLAELGW